MFGGRGRGGVRKGSGNGPECGMLLKPHWPCSTNWFEEIGGAWAPWGLDSKMGEGNPGEISDVAGWQLSPLSLSPLPSSSLPPSPWLLKEEVVQRTF